MAQLSFRSISKSFDAKRVLDDVTLDIKDGELMALLGPSGCGKTTMLRLAAGFERPSEGGIYKDDTVLSNDAAFVAPEDRNMGIVFQSYALWPNMSVAENISYPLKIRKMPIANLEAALEDALHTVSLTDYADASPSTLSGGQRQRVALARCLVMNPDAVLLDEPLANLDAHLRDVMQQTFVSFHRKTAATMVYVTHDQAEAMAMADRICVMFDGKIAQVASPQQLYRCPETEQVARFIGQSSLLTAYLERAEAEDVRDVVVNGQVFSIRQSDQVAKLDDATPVRICVRPEHIALDQEFGLPARVVDSTYLGERFRLTLETPDDNQIIAYSSQPAQRDEPVRFGIQDGWAIAQDSQQDAAE